MGTFSSDVIDSAYYRIANLQIKEAISAHDFDNSDILTLYLNGAIVSCVY